jgi:hypothetical protein
MQNMVFTMLKILKLCKTTFINTVTKCIKQCFVCKFQIILKDYLDNKIISENVIESYPIVKCCTYHLR